MVQVLWSIYFKWISTNSFYFLYFAIALNGVTGILGFVIPESPSWNYGTEHFEECRAMIAKIAKWNKVTDYEDRKFDAENHVS